MANLQLFLFFLSINCIAAGMEVSLEKPNISNLKPIFKSYGYPPEVINLSWKAVPSNGDILSYTVSYLACGQVREFHKLKKTADWCSNNSSTSLKVFSCDLVREIRNEFDVPNYCQFTWNIAVANRFGISQYPVQTENLFIAALCPRPKVLNVKPSGRRSILVEICPTKYVRRYRYAIDYKVEFCPAVNQLTSQVEQKVSQCFYEERPNKLTNRCVQLQFVLLKDGWYYEVSVLCRLITGNRTNYSDLKAGPYTVMTEEQAPARPPSLPWISLGPSREDHIVANVSFKLPQLSSFRGKPREFIVQYWLAGFSQATINETFNINETSIAISAPVSVNITVEGAKNYQLRVTLCTVACGPWSLVVNFSSFQHPQILNNHFPAQESGWWLIVLLGVVAPVTLIVLLIVFLVLFKRKRRLNSSHSVPPLTDIVADLSPEGDMQSNRTPLSESTGEYTDDNRTNSNNINDNDDVSSGDIDVSFPLLKRPASRY